MFFRGAFLTPGFPSDVPHSRRAATLRLRATVRAALRSFLPPVAVRGQAALQVAGAAAMAGLPAGTKAGNEAAVALDPAVARWAQAA